MRRFIDSPLLRRFQTFAIRSSLSLSLSLSLGLVALSTAPALPVAANEELIAIMNDLAQSDEKWVEVELSSQTLIAWEGDNPVLSVPISSGRYPDETLTGVFNIQLKFDTARMQNEVEKTEAEDQYDIPDVPYVMYYDGSYALHGAYWHDSFGYAVSRGCVNMSVDDAAWLFNWSYVGTPVVVHE
jgi:lipoprotein-anchoring transpeptidase ErfK/SrfK